MEHYKLMVGFLTKEELNVALFEAFTVDNQDLAKVISDEIFERKLQGKF
jgi:hypothetical protein